MEDASFTEKKVTYFEKPGKENTDNLLQIVKDYADREGVKDVVVATTSGSTGIKASKLFKGYNLVVVTHSFGFAEPGKSELLETNKKQILADGAKLLTGTHALSGVERAVRKDFGTIELLELIAHVLRLMGEGTKVCIEITLMAADAGLIPVDRDIIAIAGSGTGVDTALRVLPSNSARFFDLKIREVIAKPSDF